MRPMPSSRAPWFAMMAVACAMPAAASACRADPASAGVPADVLPRILVFSRTAGFRHDSIPDGIRCLKEIGATRPAGSTSPPSAARSEALPGGHGHFL